MTDPTGFSPSRSDAIRAELVDVVDERPVRGGRRLGTAVGLVLAGVLVGGGAATAAAAALWDDDPTPAPSYGITVTDQGALAPDGGLPGQPIVIPVGGSVVVAIGGEDRILDLVPEPGATHVRVTLTCTTPGLTSWGMDPGGNNPSVECFSSDFRPGAPSPKSWMDFSLADGDAVYVRPRDGAESILSLQYLTLIETAWGVNSDGETFGVSKPGVGDPDLTLAIGVDAAGNSIEGYVRSDDLSQQCPGAAPPASPEQAVEQQEVCQRDYPEGFDVPLYASDGVTRIGAFHIG